MTVSEWGHFLKIVMIWRSATVEFELWAHESICGGLEVFLYKLLRGNIARVFVSRFPPCFEKHAIGVRMRG